MKPCLTAELHRIYAPVVYLALPDFGMWAAQNGRGHWSCPAPLPAKCIPVGRGCSVHTRAFSTTTLAALAYLIPDAGPFAPPLHRTPTRGTGFDRKVGFAARARHQKSNRSCGSAGMTGLARRGCLRLAWRVTIRAVSASDLWARRRPQTTSRAWRAAVTGSTTGAG